MSKELTRGLSRSDIMNFLTRGIKPAPPTPFRPPEPARDVDNRIEREGLVQDVKHEVSQLARIANDAKDHGGDPVLGILLASVPYASSAISAAIRVANKHQAALNDRDETPGDKADLEDEEELP